MKKRRKRIDNIMDGYASVIGSVSHQRAYVTRRDIQNATTDVQSLGYDFRRVGDDVKRTLDSQQFKDIYNQYG